jgi:DNA adenine methylase
MIPVMIGLGLLGAGLALTRKREASGMSGLGDLGAFEGECPSSLQPLIQWPGGKARMAKRLMGMFPEHETYVEPFAGGASVFFAKPLVKKNVISDMDPWLIDLYKDVKSGKLASCEDGIKPSKDLFGRALKNKNACHKVALSTLSFHGNRTGYYVKPGKLPPVVQATKLGKRKCYEEKLKHATVIKQDFATTMRKHDSKKTLHFLDPPWPMDYSDLYHGNTTAKRGKSKDKKAFGGAMDPKHVRKVADGMKGTVVVIYNWTPELQKTFSGGRWKTQKIGAYTGGTRTGGAVKPNLVAIKRAA